MSICKPTDWILTKKEESYIFSLLFQIALILEENQDYVSSSLQLKSPFMPRQVSCLCSPWWHLVGRRQHCKLFQQQECFKNNIPMNQEGDRGEEQEIGREFERKWKRKDKEKKIERQAGNALFNTMSLLEDVFYTDSYFLLSGLEDFKHLLGKRVPFKRSTALIFHIIFASQELY